MVNISTSLLTRSSLLLLVFLFVVSSGFGQQRTVTGVVSSQEGPLPGVNIVVQGTTQGTMTGADGSYSISVPGPDAVLVFSFISYAPQTITVGDRTTIDVTLLSELSSLDEVVVVGYGTQQRREVTSSISNVNSEQFNRGSVSNPVQLIQGKVAGLAISKPGGDPNGEFNIRLRGLSTIGANLGPLVVIDGVIGGSLQNVDPNDIESINVLKDGSAAAIYGTRGSSGVILVTTKKGRAGTTTIDYNVYGTVEMVARNTDVMDASQWRALRQELIAAGDTLGTDFGGSTNWFEEIERTAYSQVHNIALSGGGESSSYRASINYRNAQGVMINTGFDQINGRINLNQKALRDKFSFDLNLGATERRSQRGFEEAFRYATIFNPTAPVRNSDPQYDLYDGYFQQVLFDYYNPVSILELNKNENRTRIYNASLRGSYEIVEGLSVDAFYATQGEATLVGEYFDKNDYWGGLNRNGLATRDQDNVTNNLFETTARYIGDISSSLSLNVLGGYSYQDFMYEGFYAQGGDFLTDALTFNNLSAARDFDNGLGTVTSYRNTNKLIAFFGRVNLNINNNFFIMASARYEGSSRFGIDNKWGLFPAVGLGADVAGYLNAGFIDNLKLRVNWGLTGNQPTQNYLSIQRLGPSGYFLYNGEYLPTYDVASNANRDLAWERKSEFDAGFDFSILDSKLSGSFDFYTRTTTDLLFEYEVPIPPNLYRTAWMNLGELRASGIELTLNYNVISQGDLAYTMTFTPSYNISNTLVSLSGTFNGAELKYGRQDIDDMGSPGQNQVPLIRVEEGEPVGQIISQRFQEIDTDGNLVLVDTNNDGTVDAADRQIVGNGLPKFLIGWGHSLAYKRWDLSLFFRGVFGHDLINSFRGFYEVPNLIGSYNLPTTATNMRNSQNGTLMNSSSNLLSDIHVESADFVSLDNMALGYSFNLPQGGVFNRIRVYLAGNNLFYLTDYSGVDPNPRYVDNEDLGFLNNPLTPGIDRRNTWFRTRSFTLGANIIF
jgi:TonB-dependent starch-binding outer membrane protein SusC